MLKYIESTKYDLHCTNPRHSFESRIDIREDEQKTVRFCVVCGKQLVPGLNPYKTPVCGGCGKEVAPVFWDYCLYCGMKLKE